jgi:hypothetical protein
MFYHTYKLVTAILFAVIATSSAIEVCQGQSTGRGSPDAIRQAPHIPISENTLYSESLSPNSFKSYTLEVLSKSLLIFCLKIDTEGAQLESDYYGPISRASTAFPPFPEDVEGHLYYVAAEGEVTITIANPQQDQTVHYRFFIDLSGPLQASNSKIMPLEGCPVAFHVDLKRDDELSMDMTSDPSSPLEVRTYFLYYVRELGSEGYLLKLYAETSQRTLEFSAALEGRYYIIIRPVEEGEPGISHIIEPIGYLVALSLASTIISPLWNQEWLWPFVGIALSVLLSSLFLTKIKNLRSSEKTVRYTLLSDCCSFVTLALFGSLIGAYNSRTFALMPLLYSSILVYGLSLGSQIYAAHLSRKSPVAICPHCFKRINLAENSFCCDKKIKRISEAWYLAPAAFGLLFFLGFSSIGFYSTDYYGTGFPTLPTTSYWLAGVGCVVGGLAAWAVTRGTDRKKSWTFLAVGLASSYFFPILIGFTVDLTGLFRPVHELELYPNAGIARLLIQVNALPTIPLGFILAFASLATGLSYLLLRQVKMSFVRSVVNSNVQSS